tara:strand:+ start:335 stop:1204 length:870 start_codon:yes stop_codon:yes gene_type:complete
MIWTQEITNTSGDFKNSSFMCNKSEFSKLLRSGSPFLRGAISHLGVSKMSLNKEIALQNLDFLQKYKNSKILIIGSGPSFNDYSINPDDYDFIWSCNYFYKNDKLRNLNVSLITLGNENDLFDESLVGYLNNNDTIVCFENKYTQVHEMGTYKKQFENRVFWAFTRYHSRIGSVPRLACIAAALGAKQIGFVGMDGYYSKKLHENNLNAFRPNIKPSGTIEERVEEELRENFYMNQYLSFWDYMLHDIGKDIKFINAGHGHPCNNSTKVLIQKLGENYSEYLLNPEKRK